MRRLAFRLAPGLCAAYLRPSDAELGLAGERLAARHLAERGLALLARRLVTRAAELDLVLEHGDTLVVCEVKTARRVGRFSPADRFDASARRRLAQAAAHLARLRGRQRARVDLVEVLIPARSRSVLNWSRGVG